MSNFAQRFQIRVSDVTHAHPGQFVHSSNDSVGVCGFIRDVSRDTGLVEMVLFEPTVLSDKAEVLEQECNWVEMLNAILVEADDEIASMWEDLFNE